MRLLYLIRHATPLIRPETPAREWVLSDSGQREAGVLAGTADAWGLEAMYAASEPKMRATALIIGDALGLPVHIVPAFDELRIPQDWITNADEFNDLVRGILDPGDKPTPRGCEPSHAAAARFAEGIELTEQGPFPAALVSGGRILTSYLTHYRRVEQPFDFWRAIPLPGWTVIDLDEPHAGVAAFAP